MFISRVETVGEKTLLFMIGLVSFVIVISLQIAFKYLLSSLALYFYRGHQVTGLSYTAVPPKMADALMLMMPSEQERFVENCLSYITCSRQELQDYVWQSQNIQEMGEDRFWFTYLCTKTGFEGDCPVDGSWSRWSLWDECSVSCGLGTQGRYRTCSHPWPYNGGRECDGPANQVTGCEAPRLCLHSENATAEVESVLARAWKFLQRFFIEDPELEQACLGSHCSYQEVQDMITPRNLAEEYWTHLNCYKHLVGCPVDGGWSTWSTWSGCSSNCGEGTAYRTRECDYPRIQNYGKPCEGSTFEEGLCFDDTCNNTVGVFLTPWSPWSECIPTDYVNECGKGVRVSRRRCHGDTACPAGNGSYVNGLYREVPCESDVCPELGGFSQWKQWSRCTGSCSEGYHVRQRVCNYPRPRGFGMQCTGETYELEGCHHDAPYCAGAIAYMEYVGAPEYTMWSNWGECTASCDGGLQTRSRSCMSSGQLCVGELFDYILCNDDVPCPVNGGWSEWTSWSVCSETCGEAISSRYRHCINPRPDFGGQVCEGETHQEQMCDNQPCPVDAPEWNTWQGWTLCSSSCGGGTKSRERDCRSGGETGDYNQGQLCAGEIRQVSVCNYHQCPVDGYWANWGEWSECSVSCDEGTTVRDRTCTDPTPVGGGQICDGFGTEMRNCYNHPCETRGSMIHTFDGTSFIAYRRTAIPTKHLFVYIRFSSAALSGLLLLRRHDEQSAPLVSVRLENGYIRLYARTGLAEVDLLGDQIKSSGWNTAELAISGKLVRIRVNGGLPIVGNFSAPPPVIMDWDLKMYVGGTMPHLYLANDEQNVGFVGKIAALRINYHEYSLRQVEEWHGLGLPYVSLNVGEQTGEIDAEIPEFFGREYTVIPYIHAYDNMNESRKLDLSMVFKAETQTGLLLYVPGQYPGSFVAVGLSKSRLALYMNMGAETVDASTEAIALSEWIMIRVAIRNFAGELRINRGPAIQLSAPGPPDSAFYTGSTYFRPSEIVYVGGVNLPVFPILRLSIGDSSAFVGQIYKVTINTDEYVLRTATLTSYDKYIDSASASISAHYREVHATINSDAWLRCDYSLAPPDEVLEIKWLKWDQLLNMDDVIERVDDDPTYPQMSSLHLQRMTDKIQGIYACQLRYSGEAFITHAFGISIYKPAFTMMANDMMVELLVLMSVIMSFGFVIGVIFLSCFKCLRYRSYFLDRVYESIVTCFGCQRCAAGKSGYITTFAELRAIDETFEGFSARKEKYKLDEAMIHSKCVKLKEKARMAKNKAKDKLQNIKKQPDKVVGEQRQKSSLKLNKNKAHLLRKSKPQSVQRSTESGSISSTQSAASDSESEQIHNQEDDSVLTQIESSFFEESESVLEKQSEELLTSSQTSKENNFADSDEPIYENIGDVRQQMSRRESILAGIQDIGGHMFNHGTTGATSALSAAIVDIDEDIAVTEESAEASLEEHTLNDLSDIDKALDHEHVSNVKVMTSNSVVNSSSHRSLTLITEQPEVQEIKTQSSIFDDVIVVDNKVKDSNDEMSSESSVV